jgi:N-acetylneuraminic acid mutarotase
MPTFASRATATLLSSGKVLVAGGDDNNGHALATAAVYDPTANAWSAVGKLAHARTEAVAVRLRSGRVLVAGGSGIPTILGSAELFNPSTKTWSTAASLHTARTGSAAALLHNGKVLVVGGYHTSYLSSAELYNPSTNAWSSAGSMSTPREFATATVLASGKVLVAGGTDGVDLASAELYDPTTNAWTPAGAMAVARVVATATLLPSGQVLVAGGSNTTGDQASAELYDPATNAWTTTDAMATPRATQGAALLRDGRVLVAGGASNGAYTAAAELYDPTLGYPHVAAPSAGAAVGATVAVAGTSLGGAMVVRIDGATAPFQVVSRTKLLVTVPTGALSGTLSVTTPVGVAWSATRFKVLPTLTGLRPGSGRRGATVTLSGSALTGASRVSFNGKPARFTVEGYATIVATVPSTATTGFVVVTTVGGTARSPRKFTVS